MIEELIEKSIKHTYTSKTFINNCIASPLYKEIYINDHTNEIKISIHFCYSTIEKFTDSKMDEISKSLSDLQENIDKELCECFDQNYQSTFADFDYLTICYKYEQNFEKTC